jgi:hypothetical protein
MYHLANIQIKLSCSLAGGQSGFQLQRQTRLGPCLVFNFSLKFYYAKRRFSVTSKYWHMHGVINVDEIKN